MNLRGFFSQNLHFDPSSLTNRLKRVNLSLLHFHPTLRNRININVKAFFIFLDAQRSIQAVVVKIVRIKPTSD